ncbi:MAG: HD domain-containing protein [Oscillospiraceae bacterium]|nr:HD domain-containing protein [Oscillospiraceae bacterium]
MSDVKSEFIKIYSENIKREGADKLLEYLRSDKSDFFKAPASARYHGSYEGGLAEHSVNVYHCLKDYLLRERAKTLYKMDFSSETAAIAALLHDICKVNFYTVEYRNRKNSKGEWEKYPAYAVNDALPYGHGEKSVYIITGFMKLSREEAFAIRYHMGFSGANCNEDKTNVGNAFEKFPLAFALSTADMEATYFIEGKHTP